MNPTISLFLLLSITYCVTTQPMNLYEKICNKIWPKKSSLIEIPSKACPKDLIKFKETGSCVGCNLANEDLREIFNDIRKNKPDHKIDLNHANLWRVNISGVTAHRANFSGAYMRDAVATDVRMVGAKFDGALLHRINFYNAILLKSTFKKAHCGGANFAWTSLDESDFEDAVLEPSGAQVYGPANTGSFYKALARWSNFKNTKWGEFDITDADFTGSDFRGSTKWFGANFSKAIMKDVIFSEDKKE